MRKGTIRLLAGPLTKDLARLQNDVGSLKRRLDRLIRLAGSLEVKAEALDAMAEAGMSGAQAGHLVLTLVKKEQDALDSILSALEDGISNRTFEEEEWGRDVQLVRDRLDAATADKEGSYDDGP